MGNSIKHENMYMDAIYCDDLELVKQIEKDSGKNIWKTMPNADITKYVDESFKGDAVEVFEYFNSIFNIPVRQYIIEFGSIRILKKVFNNKINLIGKELRQFLIGIGKYQKDGYYRLKKYNEDYMTYILQPHKISQLILDILPYNYRNIKYLIEAYKIKLTTRNIQKIIGQFIIEEDLKSFKNMEKLFKFNKSDILLAPSNKNSVKTLNILKYLHINYNYTYKTIMTLNYRMDIIKSYFELYSVNNNDILDYYINVIFKGKSIMDIRCINNILRYNTYDALNIIKLNKIPKREICNVLTYRDIFKTIDIKLYYRFSDVRKYGRKLIFNKILEYFNVPIEIIEEEYIKYKREMGVLYYVGCRVKHGRADYKNFGGQHGCQCHEYIIGYYKFRRNHSNDEDEIINITEYFTQWLKEKIYINEDKKVIQRFKNELLLL